METGMKKLFTLLLFTVIFYGAQSQMRIGLVGGPHSSSIIEKNDIEGWDSMISPYHLKRKAINIGIIAEMPIGHSKYLYFQPGIYYTAKGNMYQRFYDTTLSATLENDTMFHRTQLYANYIDIPLNIAFKLPLGKKCSFFISAGPYLSFFYNGKKSNEVRVGNLVESSSGMIDSAYVNFEKTEEDIQVGKHPNKATTFDAGINARAGFELGPILLTAFMSQGLINFYNVPYNGTLNHRVIGASFGFWLSKKVTVKPSDRDKDGVPDKSDACPDVPGLALTGGCPDTDGDGVADAVDKCPQVPGMPRYKGCPIPDTDGDGINDEDDKCPDQAGNLKYQGCPVPDTDGDGLNDVSDFCPDKPGPVDNNGCPIPDSDNDGVNDKEDKCPAVAGSKENNGCPVIKQEIVEKVNYAAKKIFFTLGSDKISSASFAAMNEVVTILKANPTLKLSVEGHSDNVGKPASNLNLSQKRADAVKNYLVQNGIDANRLEAKGFGQEQPVADNSTPEGRAANRRVELKLSQQ
jgi:OOP family OmpA-OmpF porin